LLAKAAASRLRFLSMPSLGTARPSQVDEWNDCNEPIAC
jgi:hypothetical protein